MLLVDDGTDRVLGDVQQKPGRGRQTATLLLLAGYICLLHYAYENRISVAFGYLNLRYRTPDHLAYAISIVIVGALSFALPQKMRRPTDLILWILFIMVITPSILVPQYADIVPAGQAARLAIVVGAISLFVIVAVRKGPRWTFKLTLRDPSHWWIALALISAITYGYMAATVGLHITFVSLGNVYGLRSGFRSDIVSHGAALGYLVRIQGNVLNPLVLAVGIYRKRWPLVVAAAVGQVVIFSATGFKLTLLSVPAIILFALVFQHRSHLSGRVILIGAGVLTAIALTLDALIGGVFYTEIFVDRLLLAPGELTAGHVLVFSSLPKAEWGYSFLAPWVHYPYQVSPDFIVGSVLFGSPDTSANANLFADGFSNLGYPGMFIEAVVLVVILWVVDAVAARLPLRISGIVLLVPTIALANSSVFTSLLTDGVVYAIAIMAILPEAGWGHTGIKEVTAGEQLAVSP